MNGTPSVATIHERIARLLPQLRTVQRPDQYQWAMAVDLLELLDKLLQATEAELEDLKRPLPVLNEAPTPAA